MKNGEGKEYGVTLIEAGMFCSCPDALYRGVPCKYGALLALSVLRRPQAVAEAPEAEEPRLCLQGVAVRGLYRESVENHRRGGRA